MDLVFNTTRRFENDLRKDRGSDRERVGKVIQLAESYVTDQGAFGNHVEMFPAKSSTVLSPPSIWPECRTKSYRVVPAAESLDFAFTAPELDDLARAEYERWMQQPISAGWSYGPTRDDAEHKHPSLIPCDDLPAEEWQEDNDATLQIPALLAEGGLGIRHD